MAESNKSVEYLNAILAEDREVYERLLARGGDKVHEYYLKQILDKLRSPRKLDKPVPNLKLQNKGGMESGCKNILKSNFEQIEFDSKNNYGDITFANKVIVSEVDVVRVFKALLKTGISRNPEVSESCKSVIFKIVRIAATANSTLTKELVKERLHADGYYEIQLVEGIWEIFDVATN